MYQSPTFCAQIPLNCNWTQFILGLSCYGKGYPNFSSCSCAYRKLSRTFFTFFFFWCPEMWFSFPGAFFLCTFGLYPSPALIHSVLLVVFHDGQLKGLNKWRMQTRPPVSLARFSTRSLGSTIAFPTSYAFGIQMLSLCRIQNEGMG